MGQRKAKKDEEGQKRNKEDRDAEIEGLVAAMKFFPLEYLKSLLTQYSSDSK